ncbi:NYN domain-containing protein [Roseovarius sp. MMSF_3359]|uniref:NYN domain-containing protein n=2 Tax=unclassified Roseovarius TaxID=2614913 RepID=UPI00273F0AC6|nr:NYN domain-containing protein [Roseovarius sp. MMSF_3359]
MTKIIMIDGAFFERLCSEYSKEVGFDIFADIGWHALKGDARRVFYYDALPAKKAKQSEAEYKTELENKKAELNTIRTQEGYHVRDGISRFRLRDGTRVQKGVDILLATDAMQFALNGIADEIELYASDVDFFPVFEALQNTNCRGVLRYQIGKTNDEIIFAADKAKPIRATELLRMCSSLTARGMANFNWSRAAAVTGLELLRERGYHGSEIVITYHNSPKKFRTYRVTDNDIQCVAVGNLLLAVDSAMDQSADVDYSKLAQMKKVLKKHM